MLPQILKRYDYAEIKKRMEAKGLALGEVLTREEALKDQQVAHNCASRPAYKRRYKRSVYCPFAHLCAAGALGILTEHDSEHGKIRLAKPAPNFCGTPTWGHPHGDVQAPAMAPTLGQHNAEFGL